MTDALIENIVSNLPNFIFALVAIVALMRMNDRLMTMIDKLQGIDSTKAQNAGGERPSSSSIARSVMLPVIFITACLILIVLI